MLAEEKIRSLGQPEAKFVSWKKAGNLPGHPVELRLVGQ